MTHVLMSERTCLYALDALEEGERVEFETHLTGCPECRSELDTYHATVASLIADEPADDEIWERIRLEIVEGPAGVVPIDEGAGKTARWKWIAAVTAAAAVFMAGFLASQLGSDRLTDPSVVMAADAAATSQGSYVGEFLVDEISVARIVLAADGRGFVIPTGDLPTLDRANTYQLWVINDSEQAVSAGVLGFDPGPATFTWTGDVTGFALTREVAGGVVTSAGDVVAVITDI